MGDVEVSALQQKRLMALGVRTMALPAGRAALTLGTVSLTAYSTAVQPFKLLCIGLACRYFTRRTALQGTPCKVRLESLAAEDIVDMNLNLGACVIPLCLKSPSTAVYVDQRVFCPVSGTLQPLPTEPLSIPELNLSGLLPEQQNAVVKLDLAMTAQAPGGGATADFTAWPEFHNGVAAGAPFKPAWPLFWS